MLENIKDDARTYSKLGGWHRKLGFWCVATYRFGVWARSLPPVVRVPFVVQHQTIDIFWRVICNTQVSPQARIGPGFCMMHPSNVFVPPTEIGSNFLVFHEVTLGANVKRVGYPKIGNNVKIHVGARVLGDVVVGDGARIGANCVVTTDVAPGSVVATAANRVARP